MTNHTTSESGPSCPDCEECPCSCPSEFNWKTLGLPPHVSLLMNMWKNNSFIKTLERGGRIPIPRRPFKLDPGERVVPHPSKQFEELFKDNKPRHHVIKIEGVWLDENPNLPKELVERIIQKFKDNTKEPKNHINIPILGEDDDHQ